MESYCVVTVGRVYPKVNDDPPSISNTTAKEVAEELMSKFEGKTFVKRDCIPVIDQNGSSYHYGCKKFPSNEGLDFGKFNLYISYDGNSSGRILSFILSKKKLLILNSKDFDQDSGEIYQCNICDTEACNSWGTDAMPDPRADNSAFMSELELR